MSLNNQFARMSIHLRLVDKGIRYCCNCLVNYKANIFTTERSSTQEITSLDINVLQPSIAEQYYHNNNPTCRALIRHEGVY